MWEKDAEMMQAAGINLIKTGEGAWATFEPSEGQFDFAWMDRAIKVFSAHGIKFILGTPSYSPPAWLYAKYPDVGAMNINGVRYRFGQRQVQNLSSPHYIAAVKQIVTAMGEHYANNPNVIAFSIDNEIGDQVSYDDLPARLHCMAQEKIRHHPERKQSLGRRILGHGTLRLGSGSNPLGRRNSQSQYGARFPSLS